MKVVDAQVSEVLVSIWTEPNSSVSIAVGSPIYTQDYKRIGTVKELDATAFKVETPRLRRDYWLSREAVRSIAVDGAVMLSAYKDELDRFKVREPVASP